MGFGRFLSSPSSAGLLCAVEGSVQKGVQGGEVQCSRGQCQG